MADISGYHHLSFTVTDLARSTAWYTDVLGFAVVTEVEGAGLRRNRLRHPAGGIILTLTEHEAGSGDRFDERPTGLDHLAFQLGSPAAVEALVRRFRELGVEHSEHDPGGGGPRVFFRDPDNIQLEAFAPHSAG
ncbi:MAG: VOC family protein [Actinomycetes bacterium]